MYNKMCVLIIEEWGTWKDQCLLTESSKLILASQDCVKWCGDIYTWYEENIQSQATEKTDYIVCEAFI